MCEQWASLFSTCAWQNQSLFKSAKLSLQSPCLSFLTYSLSSSTLYFPGNGVKQNTQNSYPGLSIVNLHGVVFVCSSLMKSLCEVLQTFILVFITCLELSKFICTEIVLFHFMLFFHQPLTYVQLCILETPLWNDLHSLLCVCSGIKAEEWGTFLHCKNQVLLFEEFKWCALLSVSCIMWCSWLTYHSPTFFERSLQIFRKFATK